MSIDPVNDRICYYENIMRAFVNADGFCNIRAAAECIVKKELRQVAEQPVESPLTLDDLISVQSLLKVWFPGFGEEHYQDASRALSLSVETLCKN